MGGLNSKINAYASAVDEARKAGVRAAASAALSAIKEAAETAMKYVSGLFGAATSSAVVDLKLAAGAAANTVVDLVRQLLGHDAAAAAMARFSAVVAALRCGSSSFAETVVADLDAACSAAFPFVAVLPELAAGKEAVSVVAEVRALIAIVPLVEKLLDLVIPWEVKTAIATVAVAAGLYHALCAAQCR